MIHIGDCLIVMRGMAADSVDAIVTDPPYGLSFMGKRWDYDVPGTETWATACTAGAAPPCSATSLQTKAVTGRDPATAKLIGATLER